MKATIALLLLTIFAPLQSVNITEMDLIGKWRIEGVRIVHPGICIRTDFKQIIGFIVEFTEENLLTITSRGGKELIKQTEKLSWSIMKDEIILKSGQQKEVQISEYTHNGDRFTFRITNLIELTLKRNILLQQSTELKPKFK